MNLNKTALNKHKGLSLLAENKDDLDVISALVQDAVLIKSNIKWIKKRHRFSMLINRFRWELVSKEEKQTVSFSRIHTMLAFEAVIKVSSLGVEYALENDILSLLRVEFNMRENMVEIELIFSGGILIKLEAEFIQVFMQDLELVSGREKSTIPTHKL